MRTIRRIVLHDSLTKDGQSVSWNAIRRWHRGEHPDSPYGRSRARLYYIAYHIGLELIGDHYEVLDGRPWRIIGQHARGANSDSLGFCWVGDFREEPPPEKMIARGVEKLADLCAIFSLTPDAIVRHCDVDPRRTCPHEAFPLARIREAVAQQPT